MRIACLIGWLLLTSIGLSGQNTATENYKQEPIAERGFDASDWEKMRKEMRYEDEALPEEEPEEEVERESSEPVDREPSEPLDLSGLATFILVLLSIAVVAGLLYWLIVNKAFKKNTKVEGIEVKTLEEAERDLDKADVKSFLEKALANGDYRLALRLYYLQSIKQLSAKRAIIWKRDKTNGRYLRELKGHELHKDFKQLTLDFERIWYTDMSVSKALFSEYRPAFDAFLAKVEALKKIR